MTRLVTLCAVAAALALAPATAEARVALLDHPLSWGGAAAVADTGGHLDLVDPLDFGSGAFEGPNKPLIALLFSIIPGLGQVLVNEQVGKGILFFVAVVALSTFGGFFGWPLNIVFELAAFVVWVYNLYDAYTTAGGRIGGAAEEPPLLVRRATAPVEHRNERATVAAPVLSFRF